MILNLLISAMLSGTLGVREVHATSCDIIRLNVALGMTSQLVFDEPPTLTLHADEEHFKIKSNPDAKRSIAIIPYVDEATVKRLVPNLSRWGGGPLLAKRLDEALHTNLYVFFKDSNQLMFDLRFVEKSKADYTVHVHQIFRRTCQL